ncbi:hypothetical protein BJV82DRAFT_600951 [Fennellomyces sp. T-0311]|nr:hypothetical protein BJV82DRAFT_600951 [Fennellomyces sp. T-0311]
MQYQRIPNDDVQDPLRSSPESPTAPAPHVNNSDPVSATRIPSPPPYSRPAQDQQQNDLEETFDESIDEVASESQRLLEPPRQPESSSSSPATLPVANDGVFSNMSAKPESERDKVDETPPAYEDAAADAAPPYWHTAVIAPTTLGDFILIEGLPAGNMLHFGWNLIISASFQFVGFMLTYLFHTTHAAKNGSRAGLGVTLVQFGFYVRSRGQDTDGSDDSEDASTDVVAYFLMIFGWFIITRSIADYIRIKRMERIIATQPNADTIV